MKSGSSYKKFFEIAETQGVLQKVWSFLQVQWDLQWGWECCEEQSSWDERWLEQGSAPAGIDSAFLKATMIWIFSFCPVIALAYFCCGKKGIFLASLWALCDLGNHEGTSHAMSRLCTPGWWCEFLLWGGGGWAKVWSQVTQQPRQVNIFSSRSQVQPLTQAQCLCPWLLHTTPPLLYRLSLALWSAMVCL